MYKSAIHLFALLSSVFILRAQAQANYGSAHPCLLINAAQIDQVRKDIKDTTGWKYRSWLLLKQEADRYLGEPLEIPRRGGNWEQYYFGPSGYGLTRGAQIGDWRWEHIDTVSGAILTGDSAHIKKDYDRVVIAAVHNRWAIAALQLGLAYQISQNKEYARKAKAILMAYADLYPTLPIRNKLSDLPYFLVVVEGRSFGD